MPRVNKDNGNMIDLPDDVLPSNEELKGDMRLLAEVIGVRLVLKVSQVFGGTSLRIRTMGEWLRRYRNRCMRQEYDRGDITVIALARKYKISERQAYNVLGVPDSENR